MSQLFAGFTFIVLGIVLLVILHQVHKDAKGKHNISNAKNGGIGFLLFGLYYLARYYMN